MIGYIFLDSEGRLQRREQEYIESINPRFFSDNKHCTIKVWKFNTEDRDSMIRFLKDLRDLEVPTDRTMLLLKDINFNLESLKNTNANPIQQRQVSDPFPQ